MVCEGFEDDHYPLTFKLYYREYGAEEFTLYKTIEGTSAKSGISFSTYE